VANLLFYLMAGLAVAAALCVVLARNPIASILALLASFFALATIYLLAGFQMLAAAQILVYAGAIMVLFLFVIMLLNLADEKPSARVDTAVFLRRNAVASILVAGALVGIGAFAALQASGALPAVELNAKLPEEGIDSIQNLGEAMFSRWLLPFEVISVLLLATAVAVVVLAKRNRGPHTGGGQGS
jgi:NADH-quinone oxidoreductase subunit J